MAIGRRDKKKAKGQEEPQQPPIAPGTAPSPQSHMNLVMSEYYFGKLMDVLDFLTQHPYTGAPEMEGILNE
jgi:hypothetical protein